MEELRFADCVLDLRTRRLTRAAQDPGIGSRALDLPEFLVLNRDRVVRRDEIITTVWPGRVVGDNNLNVQVATPRPVVGGDP